MISKQTDARQVTSYEEAMRASDNNCTPVPAAHLGWSWADVVILLVLASVIGFRRWEQTRGWVNRPHITPQYHTAAEMLLLQLDMLAYVDETAVTPTVVIGAGIPAAGLNQPMKVQNASTRLAQVGWNWDGHQMHVTIPGCRCKVRLGPAFPSNTAFRLEYLTELQPLT
jgi:hypothetical protein